jgi:hypothetical protein
MGMARTDSQESRPSTPTCPGRQAAKGGLMDEKYERLHNLILCMMHDLVFGGFGLKGDPQEKLLRAWYSKYQEITESMVEEVVYPPPTREHNP